MRRRRPFQAEVRAGNRLLLRLSAAGLADLRKRVDAFLSGLKAEGPYAGLRRRRAAKRPQLTRRSR